MTWTHLHSHMHSTHASQDMWVTTRPRLSAPWGSLLAHTCVGDVSAPAFSTHAAYFLQLASVSLVPTHPGNEAPRRPSATTALKGVGPYILCPTLLN